ncbi:alpha/beta hydrolase [Rhodanobacter sp. Soil772]|uniref:RBBP9/YdeN family alpha/beta hydrolase n=1 Tax=Rhodanobacter sp. Soil772 TaxID=1736406 RepID=UPI000AD114C1|nr:alpha/beta hydrolase [Rhodanobacter sp. Soil772]
MSAPAKPMLGNVIPQARIHGGAGIMMTPHDVTVVIVPGLRDHVAEHWQTLLAERLPRSRTVPPLETDKLSRAARVNALQSVVAAVEGPIVFVAHSAGVMITIHWAAEHGSNRAIHGALLAAPADLELPMPPAYPALDALRAGGWLPLPRAQLPFRSIVAASSNDPLGEASRIAGFARDWGSKLVDLGEVGHLNPASGYGDWPEATHHIHSLLTEG